MEEGGFCDDGGGFVGGAAASVLPPEIAATFDSANDASLTDLKLLLARPEREVPLEGGETTSNTDVLAICRNAEGLCIVAVEAKVHEAFDPLVGQKRRGKAY